MANCFLLLDDETDATNRKINIDELYEKRKQKDLRQLEVFNAILSRVHKRIKLDAKNKNAFQTWFQVPEFLLGRILYDKDHCIAYVMSKLKENGFHTQYLHPNTIFISWDNFVPSYIRNEVKKKTGYVLDNQGNILNKEEVDSTAQDDINNRLFNMGQPISVASNNAPVKEVKQYASVKEYRPTGIYNQQILSKLEERLA